LVEQIELLIEEDEKKPKTNEKDGSEKIESFKKAINNLIMDSPFFAHIRKRNTQSTCIDSTNFEAKCSQNEEPIAKSPLEATWLPAINLEQYTIRVGLFSLPSEEIKNLVDDYFSIFTSNLVKTQKIVKKEGNSPSLDDSWEVLEDEEEKISEERKELEPVPKDELPIQEEEKEISENDVQKNEVEKENESSSESQPQNIDSPEDLEKKKIREENKAKFVGRLYEYTEQLKKMSDKKFKRREDSCQNLLNKENNFLYILTGNNVV